MPFIKNHQTGRLLENIKVLFEPSVPLIRPYSPAWILINLNENATMLSLLSRKPSMSPISHFCVLPSPLPTEIKTQFWQVCFVMYYCCLSCLIHKILNLYIQFVLHVIFFLSDKCIVLQNISWKYFVNFLPLSVPYKITYTIHRMPKWRLNDYSFIWMLIRLTSLIFVWKFFCIFRMLTRLVRLISTKIKE